MIETMMNDARLHDETEPEIFDGHRHIMETMYPRKTGYVIAEPAR
jgi:uncharacterized protein YbaA (DUF1428 family)